MSIRLVYRSYPYDARRIFLSRGDCYCGKLLSGPSKLLSVGIFLAPAGYLLRVIGEQRRARNYDAFLRSDKDMRQRKDMVGFGGHRLI